MPRVAQFVTLCAVLFGASTAQAQSARELLHGLRGMNPAEYHGLSREADSLMAAGGEAGLRGAAQRYERLATAYPHDGENWARLGRAHLSVGDYRQGADALKRAYALGVGYQGSFYTGFIQNSALAIATAHARLGESDSALVWIERATAEQRFIENMARLGDTVFARLRSNARFQHLLGALPPGTALTRDEGWRHDLDFLIRELQRVNGVYSRAPLPDSLVEGVERLRERIPALTDTQIQVEMHRLLSMMGQSHNHVWIVWSPPSLPIMLWAFPEGIYITAADSAHRHLIGARVLRLDDTEVWQAFDSLTPLLPNDHPASRSVHLWSGTFLLTQTRLLHALGITRSPDSVRLTLEDRSGRVVETQLAGRDWPRPNKLTAPDLPGLGSPPLWLTDPQKPLRLASLPEHEAVYVGFNQVSNPQNESLAQFAARLQRQVDSAEVRTLIVDLRRNNGGNTYHYMPLLRTVIAFDQRPDTRLFVLAGRQTFSAAQNFLTEATRLTDAIVVGEPSGGAPIQYGGDSGSFRLPYSGTQVSLSSTIWQLTSPRDTRPYVAPDIPVPLTAADYFSNRDPVLEAVLRLIR